MNSASDPAQSSSFQRNAEEEDDIYNADTLDSTKRKFDNLQISSGLQQALRPVYGTESSVRTNSTEDPLTDSVSQGDDRKEYDDYDDEAPPLAAAPKYTYGVTPKVANSLFPGPCKLFNIWYIKVL